jgi:hypothetical protein
MKRVIKESEHLKGLFSSLPPFLRRRLTMEDLEWIEKEFRINLIHSPKQIKNFDEFCDYVLGDTVHEFVMQKRNYEIKTISDEEWGDVYDEKSQSDVMDIYWPLIPVLKDMFYDELYEIWEHHLKKR